MWDYTFRQQQMESISGIMGTGEQLKLIKTFEFWGERNREVE